MANERRLPSIDEIATTARVLFSNGRRFGVRSYVFDTADHGERADWTDIAPVPRAAQRYKPQGLELIDEDLWLTDHYRNQESYLYRLDAETGEVTFEAPMPEGALHPGGLAWDGEVLWALDFISENLYRINLDATLDTGRVHVHDQHPTGLRAASALAHVQVDDTSYLALSDYLWMLQTWPMLPAGTGHTFLIPRDDVDNLHTHTVREIATIHYDNGGFSQGLTWDGTYLYEAVNNLGTDRIEILDIEPALKAHDRSQIQRVGSIAGPAYMIEDLATDGERLWTTDEGSYRLYERPSLPNPRLVRDARNGA